MHVGVPAHDLAEALAKLALQESHDLADALQGEAFAAEFADHRHFEDVLHRVEAAMAFPLGLDHAPLVPPLELAGGDAGESDDLLRWEAVWHDSLFMFETIYRTNV